MKIYIIIPILLFGFYSAFAQVTNTEIGGPTVPIGNSTMQQYCWNSFCHTMTGQHLINTTINGKTNNTDYELKSHYNIIMVIPSEICTRAYENHIKTGCPPLASLIKYDTSNQKISGYFYSKDGTTLERSKPEVKNHWQYYGYSNKTIICVYCTGNYLTTDLYDTIIIQPVQFEYSKHTFTTSTVSVPQYNSANKNYTNLIYPISEINAGLTTFLNRDVQGCNTATISYSDALLNDTIHYFENGCTKTFINQTNTQKISNTPWSYDNPYSTLHYKAIVDKIKSNYMGDCLKHKCTQTTSIRKW